MHGIAKGFPLGWHMKSPFNLTYCWTELCLATQNLGIFVRKEFLCCSGEMKDVFICNFFLRQQEYLTFHHQPQASVDCTQ